MIKQSSALGNADQSNTNADGAQNLGVNRSKKIKRKAMNKTTLSKGESTEFPHPYNNKVRRLLTRKSKDMSNVNYSMLSNSSPKCSLL